MLINYITTNFSDADNKKIDFSIDSFDELCSLRSHQIIKVKTTKESVDLKNNLDLLDWENCRWRSLEKDLRVQPQIAAEWMGTATRQ